MNSSQSQDYDAAVRFGKEAFCRDVKRRMECISAITIPDTIVDLREVWA